MSNGEREENEKPVKEQIEEIFKKWEEELDRIAPSENEIWHPEDRIKEIEKRITKLRSLKESIKYDVVELGEGEHTPKNEEMVRIFDETKEYFRVSLEALIDHLEKNKDKIKKDDIEREIERVKGYINEGREKIELLEEKFTKERGARWRGFYYDTIYPREKRILPEMYSIGAKEERSTAHALKNLGILFSIFVPVSVVTSLLFNIDLLELLSLSLYLVTLMVGYPRSPPFLLIIVLLRILAMVVLVRYLLGLPTIVTLIALLFLHATSMSGFYTLRHMEEEEEKKGTPAPSYVWFIKALFGVARLIPGALLPFIFVSRLFGAYFFTSLRYDAFGMLLMGIGTITLSIYPASWRKSILYEEFGEVFDKVLARIGGLLVYVGGGLLLLGMLSGIGVSSLLMWGFIIAYFIPFIIFISSLASGSFAEKIGKIMKDIVVLSFLLLLILFSVLIVRGYKEIPLTIFFLGMLIPVLSLITASTPGLYRAEACFPFLILFLFLYSFHFPDVVGEAIFGSMYPQVKSTVDSIFAPLKSAVSGLRSSLEDTWLMFTCPQCYIQKQMNKSLPSKPQEYKLSFEPIELIMEPKEIGKNDVVTAYVTLKNKGDELKEKGLNVSFEGMQIWMRKDRKYEWVDVKLPDNVIQFECNGNKGKCSDGKCTVTVPAPIPKDGIVSCSLTIENLKGASVDGKSLWEVEKGFYKHAGKRVRLVFSYSFEGRVEGVLQFKVMRHDRYAELARSEGLRRKRIYSEYSGGVVKLAIGKGEGIYSPLLAYSRGGTSYTANLCNVRIDVENEGYKENSWIEVKSGGITCKLQCDNAVVDEIGCSDVKQRNDDWFSVDITKNDGSNNDKCISINLNNAEETVCTIFAAANYTYHRNVYVEGKITSMPVEEEEGEKKGETGTTTARPS